MIRDLTFSSPQNTQEWLAYYDLRWRILRAPWQQPRGSEKDDNESNAYHIMAIDRRNKVLGVGRIHQLDSKTAQIRYMAIDERYRDQGIGSKILANLEQQAFQWGSKNIVLNARSPAINFYQHNGYCKITQGELLFGEIAHSRMEKIISKQLL